MSTIGTRDSSRFEQRKWRQNSLGGDQTFLKQQQTANSNWNDPIINESSIQRMCAKEIPNEILDVSYSQGASNLTPSSLPFIAPPQHQFVPTKTVDITSQATKSCRNISNPSRTTFLNDVSGPPQPIYYDYNLLSSKFALLMESLKTLSANHNLAQPSACQSASATNLVNEFRIMTEDQAQLGANSVLANGHRSNTLIHLYPPNHIAGPSARIESALNNQHGSYLSSLTKQNLMDTSFSISAILGSNQRNQSSPSASSSSSTIKD